MPRRNPLCVRSAAAVDDAASATRTNGGGDVVKGCWQFMLHTFAFWSVALLLAAAAKNLYLSSIYCMRIVVRFCCIYFASLMVCYYTWVWVCVTVVLCCVVLRYVVLRLSCFISAATWSPTTIVAVVVTRAHTNKSNKLILSPRRKSREFVLPFCFFFLFDFSTKICLELFLL